MPILDLLRHTSGLTYGFKQRTNVDAAYRKLGIGELERHGTLDEMVRSSPGCRSSSRRARAWNYSVSTDVLGYLVERDLGRAVRRLPARRTSSSRSACADTDFHVRAGPGRALRRLLRAPWPDRRHAPDRRPGAEPLPASRRPVLRRRRPRLDRARLPALLPDAAERRQLDGVRILRPKTIELMTLNHLPGGKDLPALSRSARSARRPSTASASASASP